MITNVLAGILATALVATPLPVDHWQAPAPATSARAAIDLNSASVADLEGLPGIGRRTAERIVEHRQKNGAFKKIEELMNVKGIGEKSFLRLKPLITVAPPKTEKAGGTR
jgi:competence protein ComEA